MIFDTKALIEGCVGEHESRYSIKAVYLDIEQKEGESPRVGRLVASDGRMLAMLGVEIDFRDRAGLISVKAIQDARKQACNRKAKLECGDRVVTEDGTSYPRPEGAFPDWRSVEAHPKGEIEVTFSADHLNRIARAAGARCVKIIFDRGSKPILVRPLYGDRGAEPLVVGRAYDATLMKVATCELQDELQDETNAHQRLKHIKEIIEKVEQRLLAKDCHASDAQSVMTDQELEDIYTLAGGKVGDQPDDEETQ